MIHLARALAIIPAILIAHVSHGPTLEQSIPKPIMRILSRYEHLGMRALDFLAMSNWIYKHKILRRGVEWLSDKVTGQINGEVITLEEAREMVASICDAGYTIATGTCPCRRARNEISDEIPNDTDMVFGDWAEHYMKNYPDFYRKIDLIEAKHLLKEFDRHGFIHQVYGFARKGGAAYAICNCDKSVCIPLHAQKTRGFQSFRKGRSEAVIDASACKGVDECGVCIARCPFDARLAGDNGKAMVKEGACFGCGLCVKTCKGKATALVRRKGAQAQLIFARDFIK
ncbi:MAG: hypothetical protein CVT63_05280 [Candidatus Anoxymicrobium japonicum]|uniref:4Fe-4S ferredoxin-type domain-containing protein n=1 Tax=Candidatus Anoxymicrobium japonicum TaxID=2013648 RepID=A0A2N3G5G9_9ACTN|nr:MAG: hypothetical protein CVT63_05280 [Candidatus Anoxymicrobium japonicum]